MFKWLMKKFKSVNDEPSAIIAPEPTSSHVLTIDEHEHAMGISEYQRSSLMELRKFLKIISEKEIIGWKNQLKDDQRYESSAFITTYSVEFWASDRTEFELTLWHSYECYGKYHFLSFRAYEIVTAAAQGHLFDKPTILSEATRKTLVYEYLAYSTGDNQEHVKYINGVMNRTVDHVKAILEGLPFMEPEQNTTPTFHKLWEQMDLPLDTGTDLVKL